MPWPRDLSPCRCIAGSPSYAISYSPLTYYWQSAVVYKLTIILYYFSLSLYYVCNIFIDPLFAGIYRDWNKNWTQHCSALHCYTNFGNEWPASQVGNPGIKLFLARNSSALWGLFLDHGRKIQGNPENSSRSIPGQEEFNQWCGITLNFFNSVYTKSC